MTTQVPALSATTFGHASHKSVRRIGPSTSAFRIGAAMGGSGCSSSSTGISATPISDISSPGRAIWTSRRELPSTDQAPCHVHRAQWGPARLQTSAVEALALTDRPHKRRLTAGRRSHLDRDVAAAAGSQAFEQPLKNFCASGMTIGDIGHQLPCLLPDFETAARLADVGDIILCVEQRAQKCGKIFCRSVTEAEAARDLVKKLHADQFAGEVQD